jgi:hypothetical protein
MKNRSVSVERLGGCCNRNAGLFGVFLDESLQISDLLWVGGDLHGELRHIELLKGAPIETNRYEISHRTMWFAQWYSEAQ